MPRRVDHGDRRAFVTEKAAEIVISQGPEALTVRSVAAAAGFSTAVVSHYFENKRDLVRSVYRAAAARSLQRLTAAIESPDVTIACALESLLPLDEQRARDWTITAVFWGIAVADPELAAEQGQRVRTARPRIAALLAMLDLPAADGRPCTDVDRAAIAESLLTLVLGISVQAVFDPTDWTPERQRAALADGIRPFL